MLWAKYEQGSSGVVAPSIPPKASPVHACPRRPPLLRNDPRLCWVQLAGGHDEWPKTRVPAPSATYFSAGSYSGTIRARGRVAGCHSRLLCPTSFAHTVKKGLGQYLCCATLVSSLFSFFHCSPAPSTSPDEIWCGKSPCEISPRRPSSLTIPDTFWVAGVRFPDAAGPSLLLRR